MGYSLIYADPPWEYLNTISNGAAENHYGTMKLIDIKRLPVWELAAENSVLAMWFTGTHYRSPDRGALKGKHLISEMGRKFKKNVYASVVQQYGGIPKPVNVNVEVNIVLFPPDNRRRDLDNYNKALFDALTNARVWEDDCQVKRMAIEWGPAVKPGRVEITISRFETVAGAAA
ncbi:Crossover junction endodeoxyribonuclease rusA [Citrobacter freundii]|nr:Crossover junction endodeoxyribonuclease rusA [Citrobacter freundii]